MFRYFVLLPDGKVFRQAKTLAEGRSDLEAWAKVHPDKVAALMGSTDKMYGIFEPGKGIRFSRKGLK